MVNRLDGSSRVDLRESLLAEERPAKRSCTCTPCEKVSAIAKDYFNRALALSGAAMTTAGIVLAANYGFDETTAKVILYTGCGILGLAYARVVESLPPKEPRRSIELTDVGEEQTPSQVSHPNEWVAWKNRLPGEFRAWRALPTAEKLAIPANYIKGRGRLGWHYSLVLLTLINPKTMPFGLPLAMATTGYWVHTLYAKFQKSKSSKDNPHSLALSLTPRTPLHRQAVQVVKSHPKYILGMVCGTTIFSLFSLNSRVVSEANRSIPSLSLLLRLFAVVLLTRPIGRLIGSLAHQPYSSRLAKNVSSIGAVLARNPGLIASVGFVFAAFFKSPVNAPFLFPGLAAACWGISLGENDYVHTCLDIEPIRQKHIQIRDESHLSQSIIVANKIYRSLRDNSGTLATIFTLLTVYLSVLISGGSADLTGASICCGALLVYRIRSHYRGRRIQQLLDRWRFDLFILPQVFYHLQNYQFDIATGILATSSFAIFLGAYQGGINDKEGKAVTHGPTFEVEPVH